MTIPRRIYVASRGKKRFLVSSCLRMSTTCVACRRIHAKQNAGCAAVEFFGRTVLQDVEGMCMLMLTKCRIPEYILQPDRPVPYRKVLVHVWQLIIFILTIGYSHYVTTATPLFFQTKFKVYRFRNSPIDCVSSDFLCSFFFFFSCFIHFLRKGGVVIGRVCWLVRSFVTFVVNCNLLFLENWKSDFHEVCHRCSASVPNICSLILRVKVKVQGQIRRTERLSTCTSSAVVSDIFAKSGNPLDVILAWNMTVNKIQDGGLSCQRSDAYS